MDNFETYIPCDTAHELQIEKKHLSKVFWAMFISWLVSTVILTVADGVIYFIAPEIIENQWIMVGINGFYTILCVCIFALFGHGREKSKHPVTARMTPSVFLKVGVTHQKHPPAK
jgi:FtsH-binding integral membrane protein